MPRPPRIQFEGAVYHVTARGNERRAIFEDDRDRERFLYRLHGAVESFDVRLYLYCLMSNHVHFVVETPRGNLSRFMQAVLTGHANYFNLRRKRSGHLFQGRFDARLISRDEYLLRLTRYVHLNPVFTAAAKALPLERRIERLRLFRWSSYPGYVGLIKPEPFVQYEPVLHLVAAGRKSAQAAYRAFVEDGLAATDEELRDLMRRPGAIGSEHWRADLDREPPLDQYGVRAEDFAQAADPVPAERVLSAVAKAFGLPPDRLTKRTPGNPARGVAAMMLCRHAGLKRQDVARRLGLAGASAVSMLLRSARTALEKAPQLHKTLSTIEGQIHRRS